MITHAKPKKPVWQERSYKEFAKTVKAGLPLMPLHKPDDVKTLKGGAIRLQGKAPRDKDWVRRRYDSAKIVRSQRVGCYNIGVQLTSELLVVDIDPRNGGTEGWFAFCAEFGVDPDEYPCAETGGGGRHFYMRKPRDVKVIDTLEAYAGVEFKSFGRQVVCPGSIHPSGKLYVWIRPPTSIKELPLIHTNFLNAIHRPVGSAVKTGGQYSQEKIAECLEALDVTEFRDHDDWLRLMMACHHASGGDARQEFVEWSASDPRFAAEAEGVGRRWDSLHADRNDGITYRTLNKILADKGVSHLMVAADIGDDFEDEPDIPPDDDAFDDDDTAEVDWLEGGPTKAKPVMHEIRGLQFQNASEVEPEKVNWLWHNRFAIGKINFVAGFPDQGKSQITCDMAARVSNGAKWPNREGNAPEGTVLMLSAEDGAADTIVPRLKAAGANLGKIKLISPTVKADAKGRRMFNLDDDLKRVTGFVREFNDVRLVIIDPISAYMGAGGKTGNDTYKNTDVRAVLAPLAEWAERHDICVVFVSHFNKSGTGRALNRLTDSLAFGALARCGWLVIPEKDASGETGRKLFLRGKNNLAADIGGIAYEIAGKTIEGDIGSSHVVWGEKIEMSADDALNQDDVKPTAHDQAVGFLLHQLDNGPQPVKVLQERAAANSISWRTVERAKESVGVDSEKLDFGRGWQWRMVEADELDFG
jgi:hypothetical protein